LRTIFLASALLCAAVPALAETPAPSDAADLETRYFDGKDTDQDGRLTEAEWRGSHPYFDSVDDEAIRARYLSQSAERFAKVDTDNTGFVERDEYLVEREAIATEQFGNFDADRDGWVTKGEFINNDSPTDHNHYALLSIAAFEQARAAGLSSNDPEFEIETTRRTEAFGLEGSEWTPTPESLAAIGAVFDAMDLNADGLLTITEFLEAQRRSTEISTIMALYGPADD
jgi:Ca2+-binding EF-hand superfamily protein